MAYQNRQAMSTTPKRYTRFELMDTTGRVVVHCGNTQSLEQDECRTLKVFIDQPARAKDAELIQMAVDACMDPHKMSLAGKFLAAANGLRYARDHYGIGAPAQPFPVDEVMEDMKEAWSYLKHKDGCRAVSFANSMMSHAPISQRSCTCGLDTFRARLNAKFNTPKP